MISARNDEAIPIILEPTNTLTLSQRITAACAGALLTSLAVTPFDVVKVRMQSKQEYVFCGRFFDQVEPCPPGHCKPRQGSVWRMMHMIGRQEGWSSLWRGMLPTLTMAIPATVVYYVGYETIRDRLTESALTSVAPLVAGGSARMVAATLVSPLELIRTRMQAYQGSMGRVSIVWSALGRAGGWWRGLGPTLWRDVPFSAIYWATYEQLRRIQTSEHPFGAFTAGAMAGMTAAFLTTPFDVVKTRRQVNSDLNQGTWQLLRTLLKDEGPSGLFRGVVPRILKVAPACAIMIGTYETGKHLYLDRHK